MTNINMTEFNTAFADASQKEEKKVTTVKDFLADIANKFSDKNIFNVKQGATSYGSSIMIEDAKANKVFSDQLNSLDADGRSRMGFYLADQVDSILISEHKGTFEVILRGPLFRDENSGGGNIHLGQRATQEIGEILGEFHGVKAAQAKPAAQARPATQARL